MRHYVFMLLSIIGLIAARPRAADAATAAGTWKSTSGNTFVIPESRGNFDLVKQAPNGTRELYRAHWVDGMVGTQFSYVAGSATCTATFNGRNPDMVRVVCTGQQPSTWTRVANARTGRGLVGRWRSTSGNRFTIPERSRGEFDIIVRYANGTKGLLRARWVDGMVGTQFTYGNPRYTGTRDGNNRDRIRVVGQDGTVTFWERVR